MFDVNDEKARDRQIKFIEILLVIGGIIGGTQIKETVYSNPGMSTLIYSSWVFFLMGSLLYYNTIANIPESVLFYVQFFISTFSVSFGFAVIALLPYMNMEFPQEGLIYVGVILFFMVGLALYGGREKDYRKT